MTEKISAMTSTELGVLVKIKATLELGDDPMPTINARLDVLDATIIDLEAKRDKAEEELDG